jgi:hypothetical protein
VLTAMEPRRITCCIPGVQRGPRMPDRSRGWGPHGDHTSCARLLASRWRDLLRPRCTPLTCVNGYPHVLGVKGSQVQILSSRRHDGRFPFVGGAAHQRFYMRKGCA